MRRVGVFSKLLAKAYGMPEKYCDDSPEKTDKDKKRPSLKRLKKTKEKCNQRKYLK
jgi:hypothetical protein